MQIWSSTQLIKIFQQLGVNEKIGLTGRPPRPVGSLGTSKVHPIDNLQLLHRMNLNEIYLHCVCCRCIVYAA